MKVCLVSKADSFGGGASRVAEELTDLMLRNGYGAQHWSSWAGKGYSDIRRPLYGNFERYVRAAHTVSKKYMALPETIPFELPFFFRRNRWKNFNLFHFHDISSAISPLTLLTLSRLRPTVWTIHDCSPFTGGCLYPMGCERYKTGCGSCPQKGEWPIDTPVDFSRLWHGLKHGVHAAGRITLVTPSHWMADMAMSSGMLRERPTVIPNGVDTALYTPGDKAALRKEFGLPEDRHVVLLTAGHIKDTRKGVAYALQALRSVAHLKPAILLVGAMDDSSRAMFSGMDVFPTGYIGDSAKLARAYASSDLLLFCSQAENMPLTILETMACGLPALAFSVGGVPEIIKQNETGMVVPLGDVKALSGALDYMLTSGVLPLWGHNARLRAETLYSYKQLLNAHLGLYEKLIGKSFF